MTKTILADRSPAAFLDEYWQKKPLLIRGGLPNFESPLSPNELAGLACEPDVQSRLILEEGGEYPWELREGPFDADTFLELPESHWTLLVQEVDRLVPEVHDLLESVRFLPRWRIDDVMVSYAPVDGSVGAHVDNYDVFLVQARGRRRWSIGREPVAPEDETIVEDLDVRILSDFSADRTWELAPGDVLYLPPRIAHHGVALGDCMTYSIGFRAATHRELLLAWMERLADGLEGSRRYSDPELTPREHPGRIDQEDLRRVEDIIERLTEEGKHLKEWFGEFVTLPSRGGTAVPPTEEIRPRNLREKLMSGASLRRSEASRFAYTEPSKGTVRLFVDGDSYALEADRANLARLISNRSDLSPGDLEPYLDDTGALDLLTELYNNGQVYFPG